MGPTCDTTTRPRPPSPGRTPYHGTRRHPGHPNATEHETTQLPRSSPIQRTTQRRDSLEVPRYNGTKNDATQAKGPREPTVKRPTLQVGDYHRRPHPSNAPVCIQVTSHDSGFLVLLEIPVCAPPPAPPAMCVAIRICSCNIDSYPQPGHTGSQARTTIQAHKPPTPPAHKTT